MCVLGEYRHAGQAYSHLAPTVHFILYSHFVGKPYCLLAVGQVLHFTTFESSLLTVKYPLSMTTTFSQSKCVRERTQLGNCSVSEVLYCYSSYISWLQLTILAIMCEETTQSLNIQQYLLNPSLCAA